MKFYDDTENPRLGPMIDMVRDLSSATTPQEVLRSFGHGMSKLMPPSAFISVSCRDLPPGQYKITRMSPEGWQDRIDKADPWANWRDLSLCEGGLLGELIDRGRPALVSELEVEEDPVLGDRLRRYDAMVAIPLYDQGKPINWAFHLRPDPPGFTPQELEDLLLRGNLVGNAVKHVRTAQQLQQANETIRREMHRIAEIQKALLPNPIPHVPGLELAASYEVFDVAGGDMYQVLPLEASSANPPASSSDLWGIAIGDVSGHGPSAAVVMAMLHSIVHAYPGDVGDPGALLSYANDHLCAKRIEQSFVTAFTGVWRPSTQRLVYARAGHQPPLLLTRREGVNCVEQLDAVGDVPLGILPGQRYESAEVQLKPGQLLFMYTDGVIESRSTEGEQFGTPRLIDALSGCDTSARDAIRRVQRALQHHEQGVQPEDDQTMLALRVSG